MPEPSIEAEVRWADGHAMTTEREHVDELIAWRRSYSVSPVVAVRLREVSQWREAAIELKCPECNQFIDDPGHEGQKQGWRYCSAEKTWVAPVPYDGEGRANPCRPMRQVVLDA